MPRMDRSTTLHETFPIRSLGSQSAVIANGLCHQGWDTVRKRKRDVLCPLFA
jgi:hypothetical protein